MRQRQIARVRRGRLVRDDHQYRGRTGKVVCTPLGSLITSAGRLLLAMLERCITDASGTYLFCDTDSAAIVSTQRRQQVAMPDGTADYCAFAQGSRRNRAEIRKAQSVQSQTGSRLNSEG